MDQGGLLIGVRDGGKEDLGTTSLFCFLLPLFVTQLPLPLLISNDPVLESTSNNVTVRKKNLKIPHTFFLKTM